MHATKLRLIGVGLPLLLRHGYNDLGITALLAAAGVPKGSFYHHFRDKEDFALQVVDAYMTEVHVALDACLLAPGKPPLDRARAFFEATRASYAEQGYLGCLLGGLGQELSGVSDVFREKIAACFSAIARRMADCLDEARQTGEIAAETDVEAMADLLVDCWEGAALRSRLRKDARSLGLMLDFYFDAMRAGGKTTG